MAVTLDAAPLGEAVGVDATTAARLLPVTSALVGRYAPGVSDAIANEAATRSGTEGDTAVSAVSSIFLNP